MTTEQSTVPSTAAETATPTTSLTPIHWSALALAAVTGTIHLYLYATEGWLPFLLAGAGFFGAIGLFFLLKDYRRYLYLVGIPYTLAQIGGYLMFPMGPVELAVLDKVAQVGFILALAYLYVDDRKRTRASPTPDRDAAADEL